MKCRICENETYDEEKDLCDNCEILYSDHSTYVGHHTDVVQIKQFVLGFIISYILIICFLLYTGMMEVGFIYILAIIAAIAFGYILFNKPEIRGYKCPYCNSIRSDPSHITLKPGKDILLMDTDYYETNPPNIERYLIICWNCMKLIYVEANGLYKIKSQGEAETNKLEAIDWGLIFSSIVLLLLIMISFSCC